MKEKNIIKIIKRKRQKEAGCLTKFGTKTHKSKKKYSRKNKHKKINEN